MALSPSFVRSNPNAVALGVGLTIAAVDILVLEEVNPLMTLAKAAGGAAITRGLIHLDTTTHTIEMGKSKVVIAEIGDEKFAFSGVLDLKELDGLDLNTVQEQFAGKVKKAKAS
jgi:hypothetical protein